MADGSMGPWYVRWTYKTGERRYLTKQHGRFYWGKFDEATQFATEDEALDFIDECVAEGSPVDAVQTEDAK